MSPAGAGGTPHVRRGTDAHRTSPRTRHGREEIHLGIVADVAPEMKCQSGQLAWFVTRGRTVNRYGEAERPARDRAHRFR